MIDLRGTIVVGVVCIVTTSANREEINLHATLPQPHLCHHQVCMFHLRTHSKAMEVTCEVEREFHGPARDVGRKLRDVNSSKEVMIISTGRSVEDIGLLELVVIELLLAVHLNKEGNDEDEEGGGVSGGFLALGCDGRTEVMMLEMKLVIRGEKHILYQVNWVKSLTYSAWVSGMVEIGLKIEKPPS